MHWIMILILTTGSSSFSSNTDFGDEAACKAMMKAIQKTAPNAIVVCSPYASGDLPSKWIATPTGLVPQIGPMVPLTPDQMKQMQDLMGNVTGVTGKH